MYKETEIEWSLVVHVINELGTRIKQNLLNSKSILAKQK